MKLKDDHFLLLMKVLILIYIKGVNKNPYIQINTQSRFSTITSNQKFRQKIKAHFFHLCFDYIKDQNIIGDYFEFGTHKFRTFYMAYKFSEIYTIESMNFNLFDSFQGLPTSEYHKSSKLSQGNLKSSRDELLVFIQKNKFDLNKIRIFEGFYNSIPEHKEYQDLIKNKLNNRAALVCVDCNLYDSYLEALNLVLPFLQTGMILYLDDYNSSPQNKKNPRAAFEEFKSVLGFELTPFLDVGWWGKSFIVSSKSLI
jgi:hypothetical protein